jgi:hypothetical protein
LSRQTRQTLLSQVRVNFSSMGVSSSDRNSLSGPAAAVQRPEAGLGRCCCFIYFRLSRCLFLAFSRFSGTADVDVCAFGMALCLNVFGGSQAGGAVEAFTAFEPLLAGYAGHETQQRQANSEQIGLSGIAANLADG